MQPVEDHLAALLLSRRDVGVKKYGVTVDQSTLTTEEWIQHAIEEALDFAVYLERLKRSVSRMDAEIAGLKARLAQIQKAAGHPTMGTLTWEQLKVARKTPYQCACSMPSYKRCLCGNRAKDLEECKRCRRTPAEVDKLQRSVTGCCNRHADQQACDCMEVAIRVHGNGTGCSICSNPKCDNPGGKH